MKKEKIMHPRKHSVEEGDEHFRHGTTGLPGQEMHGEDEKIVDEDVKAEKQHEQNQPKQETDDEQKKIINEQEQNQVVNNDERATQTSSQPAEKPKMSDKPKDTVNPRQR